MFIRLFYVLLYSFSLVESKIEIRDANVAAIDRDEIGMIFYIIVENTNFCPYEVKVNMIECTEVITPTDRDNSFMHLIGGHMGILSPHCFKNLTLLYPNMYLHNRRGYCLISLKFKSDSNDIIQRKANVSFDTWMTKHGAPSTMRGYFRKGDLTSCPSVDQDPLNHCKPVDCHMKYLGTRNYFNRQFQRCQKVPMCIADPRKDLPDIIFSPGSNKCRDMEKSVLKGDLQLLDAGTKRGPCDEPYRTLVNVNCHFGKLNNETGICECNDGWISAPLDKNRGQSSSLFMYHMCNIEATDWYDNNSRKAKLICLIVGILAVVIAVIIVLCSFLIQQMYNCIKSFECKENCRTRSAKGKNGEASSDSKSRSRSRSTRKSTGSSTKQSDTPKKKTKKKSVCARPCSSKTSRSTRTRSTTASTSDKRDCKCSPRPTLKRGNRKK